VAIKPAEIRFRALVSGDRDRAALNSRASLPPTCARACVRAWARGASKDRTPQSIGADLPITAAPSRWPFAGSGPAIDETHRESRLGPVEITDLACGPLVSPWALFAAGILPAAFCDCGLRPRAV
jgi:hypothetical protein